VFRRCIKRINECLAGPRYDIPLKLGDQLPGSSDPPEGSEFSIDAINADKPAIASFEPVDGIPLLLRAILDSIQEVDVSQKALSCNYPRYRVNLWQTRSKVAFHQVNTSGASNG